MVLATLNRLFLGDCPEFWVREASVTFLLFGLFCSVFNGDRVVETFGVLFLFGWLCVVFTLYKSIII